MELEDWILCYCAITFYSLHTFSIVIQNQKPTKKTLNDNNNKKTINIVVINIILIADIPFWNRCSVFLERVQGLSSDQPSKMFCPFRVAFIIFTLPIHANRFYVWTLFTHRTLAWAWAYSWIRYAFHRNSTLIVHIKGDFQSWMAYLLVLRSFILFVVCDDELIYNLGKYWY